MARKRDGLVPVGEVIADLPGPVQAIRDASHQALHARPTSSTLTTMGRCSRG